MNEIQEFRGCKLNWAKIGVSRFVIACFSIIVFCEGAMAQQVGSPLERAMKLGQLNRDHVSLAEKAAERANAAAEAASKAAREAFHAAEEAQNAAQEARTALESHLQGRKISRTRVPPSSPEIRRAVPPDDDGTILSKIAASMKVGQWRTVATTNINATLRANGGNGTIFGFADNIQWDPSSRRLYYAGGDHEDDAWLVMYDGQSNSWRRMGKREWTHGYDHNALDPDRGIFFYRPFNSDTIETYNIQTENWSTLPSMGNQVVDLSCCVGLEYFPELNGLIYVAANHGDGIVLLWNQPSNKWQRLKSGFPIGWYHNFAEYNPVHKIVLFGGGYTTSENPKLGHAIHRIDHTGKITRLRDAPVPLGIEEALVTVDPVSGDYLVFTKKMEFFAYNVMSDRWRRIKAPVPMWVKEEMYGVWGAVAAPLSNYGVNLFVTCQGNCNVHLYKHSEPTKSSN